MGNIYASSLLVPLMIDHISGTSTTLDIS